MSKEGWFWPVNLRKAHYFVNSKSLCGRILCFASADMLKQGNDNSPDNCAECKRRLKKRNEKK